MQKKALIHVQKVFVSSDSSFFRYALVLDEHVICSFPPEQRFRACMAAQNLYKAMFHDDLDPLDVQIYE